VERVVVGNVVLLSWFWWPKFHGCESASWRVGAGLYSLPTDTSQASIYMVDIPGVSY
jgi:hypothetical protein